MDDCGGPGPGWYYYMDFCGDFWVPYEVPADRVGGGPGCEDCWCWEGCPPPAGPTGASEQI